MATGHTRAVLSSEAVTMRWPSGLKLEGERRGGPGVHRVGHDREAAV